MKAMFASLIILGFGASASSEDAPKKSKPKFTISKETTYITEPVDKPLVYRPNEKGYLLYSFGPDGMDSGGKSRDEDATSDDIGVQMPLPKVKSK